MPDNAQGSGAEVAVVGVVAGTVVVRRAVVVAAAVEDGDTSVAPSGREQAPSPAPISATARAPLR